MKGNIIKGFRGVLSVVGLVLVLNEGGLLIVNLAGLGLILIGAGAYILEGKGGEG